ncbi:hypothetical protein P5G50_18440 [Leifsonia sp. F6_8S_P_1B]|uniref:Uncharacterized protein n=1 Tax=Leifsonia williamsii TaxID=3035919 RepID=A0ABT8KG54_9MICO|nr:hypothetical protein [Leifsonia williamsii]MDN4616431.1 hypothetical protein [Leifsonia williamsii]
MNIPDEVMLAADDAGHVVDIRSARVIAQWARKEALREAADDPALRLSGHSGISIRKLRALAKEEQ